MQYMTAWLVWGTATLLVLIGGFWLTRWIRPLFVRDLLRFLIAGTLLVPAGAGSLNGNHAPAWIVFIFEALLQTEGEPVDALMMLVVGWALALLALIVVTAMRLYRAHGRA